MEKIMTNMSGLYDQMIAKHKKLRAESAKLEEDQKSCEDRERGLTFRENEVASKARKLKRKADAIELENKANKSIKLAGRERANAVLKMEEADIYYDERVAEVNRYLHETKEINADIIATRERTRKVAAEIEQRKDNLRAEIIDDLINKR